MTSLRVQIVTLFPTIFQGWMRQGLVARASEAGIVAIDLVDLRQFGVGKHRVTDDYPFGGGPGMVMKPEPLFEAVESIPHDAATRIILLSPRGQRLSQRLAESYARETQLILLAGHYEGVDERVRLHLATDELSIGDYVLSGGELPAMVFVDSIVRLQPGVLPVASTADESFSAGLLEHPQYTRPASYRGWDVPPVLLSGHHAEVKRWRSEESIRTTEMLRPDLFEASPRSTHERRADVDEGRSSPSGGESKI